MNFYGDPITRLIEEFSRLPGIGGRSAQRLAFHVINLPLERVEAFASAVISAKKNVRYCNVCCNFTDQDVCEICRNVKRDPSMIMVVEDPRDMAAYEKTKQYKGLYHVLHGAISPMNGVGPNELKVRELLVRLQDDECEVAEVILATNPNIEGEATAMYLSKLLKPLEIKVTRIAHGVPVGGDLEHVDEITLSRALEGRRQL